MGKPYHSALVQNVFRYSKKNRRNLTRYKSLLYIKCEISNNQLAWFKSQTVSSITIMYHNQVQQFKSIFYKLSGHCSGTGCLRNYRKSIL